MAFWVYILQSRRDGAYYVGQTGSVEERLRRHNANSEPGTRGKGPWQVVYREEFQTRGEAMAREKQIKSRKKRKFIEGIVDSTRGVAQPG